MIKQLFNGLANYIPIILKGKLTKELDLNIIRKIAEYDAINYEDPEFLNNLEKVDNGKRERLM